MKYNQSISTLVSSSFWNYRTAPNHMQREVKKVKMVAAIWLKPHPFYLVTIHFKRASFQLGSCPNILTFSHRRSAPDCIWNEDVGSETIHYPSSLSYKNLWDVKGCGMPFGVNFCSIWNNGSFADGQKHSRKTFFPGTVHKEIEGKVWSDRCNQPLSVSL